LDFDEQFFTFVVDAAPDGILIVDREGQIVFTNRQAVVLFGYEPGELDGRSVDELLPDALRAGHRAHRIHYQTDPRVRPMGMDMKLKGRRKDGAEFPVEISLSPVPAGDDFFVVAAVRDITVRLDYEARLLEIQSALLDAQQVLAVTDDRERIARDLHDTVIQRLFAAGLSLQATASRADASVRERIETIVEDLDQTIRDVRTAVFSLQSSRPAERGLRGVFLDVTGEAHEVLGFEPRVQFDGPVETIDEPIAEQLIPVLREGLSNVAKHAEATDVRVSIAVGDTIELSIADNGVGMPDSVFGGHGLSNMRSRAEAMGGNCTHLHRDGGGTVVVWSVPSSGQPTTN
jgi:two-component system sensor histidine kinase DevS